MFSLIYWNYRKGENKKKKKKKFYFDNHSLMTPLKEIKSHFSWYFGIRHSRALTDDAVIMNWVCCFLFVCMQAMCCITIMLNHQYIAFGIIINMALVELPMTLESSIQSISYTFFLQSNYYQIGIILTFGSINITSALQWILLATIREIHLLWRLRVLTLFCFIF